MDETEAAPAVDDNGIPVGAQSRPTSDDDWLAAMGSVPAEDGNDADGITVDAEDYGDDDIPAADVEPYLTESDDQAADVDLPDDAPDADVDEEP